MYTNIFHKYLAEAHNQRIAGLYNRALSLQFNNGSEAIDEIPFKHTCSTTASEVATLMFAREVLGLPVPRAPPGTVVQTIRTPSEMNIS